MDAPFCGYACLDGYDCPNADDCEVYVMLTDEELL